MRLSEYKDEEALDVLADIIEPASNIIQDPKIRDSYDSGTIIQTAKVIIKEHKSDIMSILARLDNTPVEEYHCSLFDLPRKVMEIISDVNMSGFFNLSADLTEKDASADATEITTEAEKA